MSRMLTLTHGAWATVRELARSGRKAEALTRLDLMLTRDDLPVPVAADARRLAAELCLERERFAAARRHLREALRLEPGYAKTHYLMGRAHEDDPHGCDLRAAKRFRRAAKIDPKNAVYWAAYGRAAVRARRTAAGVRGLNTAADLAPDNENVVRVVADGFLAAGRVADARRVVTAARFLCPGSRVLARLWDRVRFEAARQDQTARRTQDAKTATDGVSALLPFVRIVRADDAGPAEVIATVRRDLVSRPRPHFHRLPFRRTGK